MSAIWKFKKWFESRSSIPENYSAVMDKLGQLIAEEEALEAANSDKDVQSCKESADLAKTAALSKEDGIVLDDTPLIADLRNAVEGMLLCTAPENTDLPWVDTYQKAVGNCLDAFDECARKYLDKPKVIVIREPMSSFGGLDEILRGSKPIGDTPPPLPTMRLPGPLTDLKDPYQAKEALLRVVDFINYMDKEHKGE